MAGNQKPSAYIYSSADIASVLQRLEADMGEMKTNIEVVKTNIEVVKADVEVVKADVEGIKADYSTKGDLKSMENRMKDDAQIKENNIRSDMKAINDRITSKQSKK